MTPVSLARLHARAMPEGRAWNAQGFADFLMKPGIFLTLWPSSLQKYAEGSARGAALPSPAATAKQSQTPLGFALGRVVLDEAELLTLVTDPNHQRTGIGAYCLAAFEAEAAAKGAVQAYLEVAAPNQAARALYQKAGWQEDGRRPGYYAASTGREDAILMSKALESP